jgi:serine/threonine protein kinase
MKPFDFGVFPLSKLIIGYQSSLMSRLHSPQIVHYVESGKSSRGDVYWIVMELIEGEPLGQILERDGPFPESEVIKVSQSYSNNSHQIEDGGKVCVTLCTSMAKKFLII